MFKKLCISSVAIMGIILFNFSLNVENDFSKKTKQYIIGQSKLLQQSLDQLLATINTQDSFVVDKDNVIEKFKQARVFYKSIEFISDYLMEDVFKIPIILDEKRQFTLEAFGISTLIEIEALLAEEKISKDELKTLIKKFQAQNFQFYQYIIDEKLNETIILEALKYNCIKIETLNITDFDCETTLHSTSDMMANFQTIDTILNLFKIYQNNDVQQQINEIQNKINAACNELNKHNFYTLNRLDFTKKYIHIIQHLITQLFDKATILYLEDIYKIKRSVQLKQSNIYNKNFINSTFYSDDKYRNITPTEIGLGKKLFFDKNLSNDKKMSCATCHQPEKFFTDGLSTSITNETGVFQNRNTPTILNAALQNNFFHDMRARSLEQQVSHVVHNTQEFNISYDTLIARLNQDINYVNTFKLLYPYEQPINAFTINTALAAFQHSLIALNAPFDQYMRNEIKTISKDVENGYNLFMGKAKCGTCHFAPTFYGNVPPFFAEMESEVLSIPIVWDTLNYIVDNDLGRYNSIKFDIFKNAFKTPTLRNVSHTAPYMHNGSFKTLEEVMDFYNRGGAGAFGKALLNQTLSDKKLNLTPKEIKDIIAFMQSLTDSTFIRIK